MTETVDPFEVETGTVVPLTPQNTMRLLSKGLGLPETARVVNLMAPQQNQQLCFISGLPPGCRFVMDGAGVISYAPPDSPSAKES